MLLVAAATEKEIEPLQQNYANQHDIKLVITGVGPVYAAANLASYLAASQPIVHCVLNVGVAGAYMDRDVGLLDICLAKQEVIGDFGICMQDEIVDFDPGIISQNNAINLDDEFSQKFAAILQDNFIPYKITNFVTVNCSSGTRKRGDFLRKKFSAGCENMEGAGVAIICNKFNIPCVELRCISNMVDNRSTDNWMLDEAIEKICSVTGIILHDYLRSV